MKYLYILPILIFIIAAGCSQTSVVTTENEIAPEFTLNSINNVKISLADYKNKTPVLVVFWATWCPFCVEEIPELNKMADEYKDKINILAIDVKEDIKKVSEFAKRKNIKYTVLLDPNGEITGKYEIIGIPTNILIDKEGKILYKGNSLEECLKLIKAE